MQIQKLIVNDSYWSFFRSQHLKSQEFLEEKLDIEENIYNLTRNLALYLKRHDADENAVYGVEIKTNGSDRSSRIPLVRFTSKNQSIWKLVKTLQNVDKALIDLQDLIYYLQNTKIGDYPLPYKVLVVSASEDKYINDLKMKEYVKRKIEESGVIWISLPFISNIFSVTKKYDLNNLVSKEGAIYTAKSI